MSRAQRIVDEILESERFASTGSFADKVYRGEPILRTGAQAFSSNDEVRREREHRVVVGLPPEYRKMRAIARKEGRSRALRSDVVRVFYAQAKFMEDFVDSFDGDCVFSEYYPTYESMTLRQLRCYFTWRAKLRQGQVCYAPTSFLFVHAYELLCGIGTEPGMRGYEDLRSFAEMFEGVSVTFDRHLARWADDYVIFHGLDQGLLRNQNESELLRSILLLHDAQGKLLSSSAEPCWPDSKQEGLPSEEELLDAIAVTSRYNLARSRYARDHRSDVAWVMAHVFGRMVAHCHKRRKTDFVEGLFGEPRRVVYTMFPSAIFWSSEPHEDASFAVDGCGRYVCEHGFWYREPAFRRLETNKELGALAHAVDARMRLATDDSHPLKPRALPKYQAKFVDEEVAALLRLREQEERTRVRIDWSSLGGIRTASDRTREALLTDDERDVEEAAAPMTEPGVVSFAEPGRVAQNESVGFDGAGFAMTNCDGHGVSEDASGANELGLTADQLDLLRALLKGDAIASDGFVTLAVDAINEAFLDVVGDTVIEFDGDVPVLVEDYLDEVRETLSC